MDDDYDNYDYGDGDEYGDEKEYVAERNAYDRAGGKLTLLNYGLTFEGQTDKQRRQERINLSDEEQFRYALQMFINKTESKITISDEDITNIGVLIEKMPHIGYKNPQAFIYAYQVTSGGDINLTKLKKNIKLNQEISKMLGSGNIVTEEDILRYSRLLIFLKTKQ